MSYNLKNNKPMNLGVIPWLQSENRSGETSLSEYGIFVEISLTLVKEQLLPQPFALIITVFQVVTGHRA